MLCHHRAVILEAWGKDNPRGRVTGLDFSPLQTLVYSRPRWPSWGLTTIRPVRSLSSATREVGKKVRDTRGINDARSIQAALFQNFSLCPTLGAVVKMGSFQRWRKKQRRKERDLTVLEKQAFPEKHPLGEDDKEWERDLKYDCPTKKTTHL